MPSFIPLPLGYRAHNASLVGGLVNRSPVLAYCAPWNLARDNEHWRRASV